MPKRKHASEEVETDEKKPKLEVIDLTYSKPNITWPKEDLLKLLSKIQDQTPNDEQIAFKFRLQRIDWTAIAFNSYTPKECQETLNILLKKARKFRFLSEIVEDVQRWISQSNNNINAFSSLTRDRCNRFWFYYNENRESILKENPEITEEELEFRLLRQFHSLLEKEKLKYGGAIKAKLAKTKSDNSPLKPPEVVPAEKDVEDIKPPNKPRSPYAIFREIERVNFPKMHNMTLEWNKLTDMQKCFYIKWSDEEKQVYNEQLKQYMITHPNYKPPKIKRSIFVEKEIKDRVLSKPELPPRGPYLLFIQIYFDIVPRDESVAFTASEIWQLYSPEEKETFRSACQVLWDEYERRFDEYLLNFPPEDRNTIKLNEAMLSKRPKLSTLSRRLSTALNKKKSKKLKTLKVMEKPSAPPESVYKYFASFYRGNAGASDVWREMPEIDKQAYQSRFEEAQNKYAVDLAKYLENLPSEEIRKIKPSRCRLDIVNDSDISASEEEN